MLEEISIKEVGEMLTHIVSRMATKDDIAELSKKHDEFDAKIDRFESKQDEFEVKLDNFASELSVVRRDVEAIRETTESHAGFAKEIDHTMDRVTRIENHLGITTI
jgi:archaellum component FlaC